MSTTRILIVHARSPLHAGTGQATAAVDLPIARDRATNYPLLPGSSLKGALRARARVDLKDSFLKIFGPETEAASEHAGAVAFTDARLLLLPVRSVAGTFAWVTSPYLLSHFLRDASDAGVKAPAHPKSPKPDEAHVRSGSMLGLSIEGKPKVVLEEFDLDRAEGPVDALVDALAPMVFVDTAWLEMLKKRFCLVHDDTMAFLARHGTDIVTRVSINPETGTAKDGQLWTEENLPAESVLYSLVEEMPFLEKASGKRPSYLDAIQHNLLDRPIQLGGKATVGRGRCSLHFGGDR